MSAYDLEAGYIIAAKYRVLRHLGEGGMGSVFLVEHRQTDERFALKILNPEVIQDDSTLERFRREARTPARIDSDHVCRVVDTGVAESLASAPFMVMEYLRGQNLQDLSESIGPLPLREALLYLRQLATALDRAHTLGIVHRDLKPENLFLTIRDDGSPCLKVLDFGIAKLTGASGDLARVKATQTGDVFGTPLYMSPEQCKSESSKVGPCSDLWALGLIAHRLLTGGDYWTAETLTHLIAQIAYEPMPLASERGSTFGEAYDAWFAIICSRNTESRFATATAAINALAEALGLGELAITGARALPLLAAQHARDSTSRSQNVPAHLGKTAQALTRDSMGESGRLSGRMGMVAGVALLVGGVGFGAFWASGVIRGELAPAATTTSTGSGADAAAAATAEPVVSAPVASAPVMSAEPVGSAKTAAPVKTSKSAATATSKIGVKPTPHRVFPHRVVPRPVKTSRPTVPPPPVDPLSGRH